MIFQRMILPIALALAISSCSTDPETAEEASAESGMQVPSDTDLADAAVVEVALSEAAQLGSRVYLRCRACHTLAQGEPHSTGPNLHGLLGATAGEKEGYVFSPALASSGIIWNRETLDRWIEAPQQIIPGNKMAFAGISSEKDRAALIQYLEETTR